MALHRRSGARFEANIWPGFVDAMTALLLVLIFVLSIFMIIQFVLRDTITGQDEELDSLTRDLASLASVLSLEERRTDMLTDQVGKLRANLDDSRAEETRMTALIASLSNERDAAAARSVSFEQQVAGLLADVGAARRRVTQ